MTHRILFVCLGNICRSPAAEGVLRHLANEQGMALEIDSAGTGAWHLGEPPYGKMQAAARARGIDLTGLRARKVTAADFDRFDLILAMDDDNFDDLEAIKPVASHAVLRKFMEYDPDPRNTYVPDPYYTGDFNGALDLIETAARAVLDDFRAGQAG